jgi:FlaA1/EpsC-like NDP-sugar epimerase
LLILLDAICVLAAYLATLAFRFGGKVPEANWATFENSILFIVLIYLVVNALCRLYSTLWEHASIEELLYVIGAAVASTILCYTLAVIRMDRMPRSIYIAAGLIIILLHGGLRLSYRVFRRLIKSNLFSQNKIPVLVIGAGDAGADIIRQMQEMPGIEIGRAHV